MAPLTAKDMIDRVLSHEGGFTNDPNDPGNYTPEGKLLGTKYGISARSYPTLDIPNITREAAIDIYEKDFYNRNHLTSLLPAAAFHVLDAAVNHGRGNAIRWMQEALKVAPDGKVGPITKEKMLKLKPDQIDSFILLYSAIRLEFYTKLDKFNIYGKGWVRRTAKNMRLAAEDLE